MSYTNPTVTEFKEYFSRDFPYGANPAEDVTDADITRAMNETNLVIPQGLFPDQDFYTTGFLYLSAHNLVENLGASSQGIGGQYEFNVNSKSVGSVSVGMSIPENILKNPAYSFLTKTKYGAKYLQLVYPFLVAPIFTVEGRTRA